MINPEIGKLPKTTVDRIPLVIYIPPPPEGVKSALGGIPHSYPPKTTNSPQPRFKLLKSFRKKEVSPPQDVTDEKNDGTIDTDGSMLWEANWELGEYPFVALEGSRAACAICLMDFEEPKRKEVTGEGSSNPRRMEHTSTIVEVVNSNISNGDEDQEKLKLVDAGDSGQPLRLLPCSHVFHVCLISLYSSFRYTGLLTTPGISENMLGSLAHRCIRSVSYMPASCRDLWAFKEASQDELKIYDNVYCRSHLTFYTRRTRRLL